MRKALLAFFISGLLETFLSLAATAQTTTYTVWNIDQLKYWTSCDVCAGPNGAGTVSTHWFAQFQTSPAIDGSAMQFFLGPSTAYASALWWRQMGPHNSAAHFTYDLQFYLTDIAAAQALEFDVNQTIGGVKYIFGTECDLRGTYKGYWRLYDADLHWQATTVPCTGVTVNTWHHLTWELERTTDGHTHFIAVTLDGTRHAVDIFYNPRTTGGTDELNAAFQMDGNKYLTAYSVWIDKMKLTYW